MKRSAFSFSLVAVLIGLQACTKTETVVEQTQVGDPFQIRADQYSLNSYFVDTSYIPYYEPYYQNEPPIVNPSSQIVEEEVWVQQRGSGISTYDRIAVAWTSLPSRSPSGYDSTFRLAPEVPGAVEYGRFYRLDHASYKLDGDGYVGVINFYVDPVPDAIFAVAYRRADGTQYGDFLRNGFTDTTDTPMVLKMVKPRYLFRDGPLYSVPWKMLLKNIYVIYPGHISRHYFQLDVMRTSQTSTEVNLIQGRRLLNVLGLDRFTEDGTPAPNGDGLFDFRLGRTFVQSTGEVIFPSLRPFDTGITRYFVERGLAPPDASFLCPELYDSTQVIARQSSRNRYSIRGRAIFD
jgi:hypothetical protein